MNNAQTTQNANYNETGKNRVNRQEIANNNVNKNDNSKNVLEFRLT